MSLKIGLGRQGLSIVAVTGHNCMGRYEPDNWLMVLLLTYHSEHAGAHGKMDGVKSLCTGSVLKCGIW
jgi:hypothetical protein